jgi:two-component sensor histidine kinase
MAAIHESLYQSADLARIDFADYARQLCGNLFRSYLADSRRVRLELELTRLELDLALAIPLGLLLNEIVSNALKHAFPAGRSGQVVVELAREGDACCRLAVRDDGIGIPADVDLDQPGTLGLGLVTVLTRQVGGTMQLRRHPGTAIAIVFPLPASSLEDGHE